MNSYSTPPLPPIFRDETQKISKKTKLHMNKNFWHFSKNARINSFLLFLFNIKCIAKSLHLLIYFQYFVLCASCMKTQIFFFFYLFNILSLVCMGGGREKPAMSVSSLAFSAIEKFMFHS